MYQTNKPNNRQFQEAATQRKAANDTQYFWELYSRHMAGHPVAPIRKMSKAQEEAQLFTKKAEETSCGVIDDNIPVQRSGPRSEEIKTLETFGELQNVLPPCIKRCLELLRFDRPTPIQKHSIPLGLAGLDLMCCAQTGSGKTLAFLIPVVTALDPNASARRAALILSHSEGSLEDSSSVGTEDVTTNSTVSEYISVDMRGVLPRAIVLAPTRELASQIHLDARRLTLGSSTKSVCVYGGNDIRSQLVELCTGCELIVATPGRLNDLVERGVVSLSQVSFLVLDEADRMLDMGFEPQIRRIVLEYDMPRGEDRQTFMFSATFPSEIQTLAREFLRNYVWIAVGRVGSTVENIKQQVLSSSSDPNEKIKLLMGVLDQTNGRTLVFVQKRKTASWLCETLRNIYGISVEEIHGDRSQAQRENALRLFRDGNIRILVATDVAARGLDVPAVLHVIQFDMPLSSEDFDVYVHRIGRTGRAGMSGLATSFFVPGREIGEGNGKIAPQLLRLLQENNQEIPEWFSTLDDVYSTNTGYSNYNRRPNQNYSQNNRFSNNSGRFGYYDSRSNQQNSVYQGNAYPGKGAASSAAAPQSNHVPDNYGGGRQQYYQRSQTANQYNNNVPRQSVPYNSQYYQQQYGNVSSSVSPQLQQYGAANITPQATANVYNMQGAAATQPAVYGNAGGYYDPYSGTYIPGAAVSNTMGVDAVTNQFSNISMQQQQQQWMAQQPSVAQQLPNNMNQHASYAQRQGNAYSQNYNQRQNGNYQNPRAGYATTENYDRNYHTNTKAYYPQQNAGYGNQDSYYNPNGYTGSVATNNSYKGPGSAKGGLANYGPSESDATDVLEGNNEGYDEKERQSFDNNLSAGNEDHAN